MSYLKDLSIEKKLVTIQSLLVDNDCSVRDENGFLFIPTKFCSEFCSNSDLNQHNEIDKLLNGDTDLIPNQYEGGFKIWEGLIDIVKYLEKNPNYLESFAQRDHINILDLGCGSGILGIFLGQTLRKHNSNIQINVFLQDFNKSVIETFTLPNVILNEAFHFNDEPMNKEDIEESYRFLYGDWSEITELLDKNKTKFDLIVTAETLYSEENYDKLCDLFIKLLKDNGQILIGTKSHYFGVGGGSFSFMDHIDTKYPKMTCSILNEINATLLRHILLLKKK